MKYFGVIETRIVLLLLLASFNPFESKSQIQTIVSGKGKLLMVGDWEYNSEKEDIHCDFRTQYFEGYSFDNYANIPKIKPYTKTIEILVYELKAEFGSLGGRKEGGQPVKMKILCDPEGNITRTITENTWTSESTRVCEYRYENGKISETTNSKGQKLKFTYNSKGFLEKIQYYSKYDRYLFVVKTDNNGNIIGSRCYSDYSGNEYTNKKNIVYKYDNKGNLTNLSYIQEYWTLFGGDEETHLTYNWKYNSKGNILSYSRKQQKNNTTFEHIKKEYDYDSDGNITKCTIYNCGDITTIKRGEEFLFSYSFYPTAEDIEAEKLCNEASSLFSENNLDDALEKYKKALSLSSNNVVKIEEIGNKIKEIEDIKEKHRKFLNERTIKQYDYKIVDSGAYQNIDAFLKYRHNRQHLL